MFRCLVSACSASSLSRVWNELENNNPLPCPPENDVTSGGCTAGGGVVSCLEVLSTGIVVSPPTAPSSPLLFLLMAPVEVA